MTDEEVDIELTNRRAIEYARWLAKRDGKRIPKECPAEAVWGDHKHVKWVTFTISKKRRVHIDIPNWDWQSDSVIDSGLTALTRMDRSYWRY